MKTPISESIGITVQRDYGSQKSRVQHGHNIAAAWESIDKWN